jgi:hypothetical protein
LNPKDFPAQVSNLSNTLPCHKLAGTAIVNPMDVLFGLGHKELQTSLDENGI